MGYECYICTRCGDIIEFEIPNVSHGKAKHSFQDDDGSLIEEEGEITKTPTCTEEGEMTFKCKDGCGTEIKITIPATGHQFPSPKSLDGYVLVSSSEPGCTKEGGKVYEAKCLYCDEYNKD